MAQLESDSAERVIDASGDPGRGDERRRNMLAAALIGLVAVVPRLLTIGRFFNLDESLWMGRSERFSDALLHLDLAHMSATRPLTGTMPGIPTVWLGSLGRLIWSLGGVLGIVDPGQRFSQSASAYVTAQAMVGIATALLIGLFVWLVARWISLRVAIVAGAVLATEPFWVSLGSILHTDELVALFGVNGLVALSWTLGLPSGVTRPTNVRQWAIISGVLLVLAPLTKVNGLAFAVPALGMVGWAVLRDWRARDEEVGLVEATRPVLALVGWMTLAGFVVTLVTYPALFFGWAEQKTAFEGQLRTANGDRKVFFLGHYAAHPDLRFYPVTLTYHSTAWFSIAAPIGVAIALARRSTRRFAATVLAWTVVPMATMLRSGLVYARYGLVVLGPLALAAACAVHPAEASLRWWSDRANQVVSVAVGVMLVVAVVVAPWGGITFNPIASAYREPILVLPLGWGETTAKAMRVVEADAHARGLDCSMVSVSGIDDLPIPGDCVPHHAEGDQHPDYVIVQASTRQRFNWTVADLPESYDQIAVLEVQGQRIGEVWRRKDLTPSTADGAG